MQLRLRKSFYLLASFSFLLGLLCNGSALAALPFQVQESKKIQSAAQRNIAAHILDKAIVWNITEQRPENLYVATVPKEFHAQIGKSAKVLFQDPSGFLVLEASNAEQVADISGDLHHITGVCGSIRRLNPFGSQPGNKNLATPIFPITDAATEIKVREAVQNISGNRIIESVREIVGFETRFHNNPIGQQTAQRLRALYGIEVPADRSDVELATRAHRGSPQHSLVIRIQGTQRPQEVIVLGSHLDAINQSTQNRQTPGADDNASGTATNIEIFRALMRLGVRPQRTIEIHAYAAEEIGLVGSQEIAAEYANARKNVIAMVQFDMNGYRKSGPPKIWLVRNDTNAQLNQFLGSIVDRYTGVTWGSKDLWMGTSDHYSWTQQGFAASFPTEDPSNFNNALHTSRDQVESLNAVDQMEAHAKMGIAFLLHYAGWQN